MSRVSGFPGEGKQLKRDHPDEGSVAHLFEARSAPRNSESGQAMVEFALILVPLLILVVGIIQFGIGLNYWLDMNRVANQGARWADGGLTGPRRACARDPSAPSSSYIHCRPRRSCGCPDDSGSHGQTSGCAPLLDAEPRRRQSQSAIPGMTRADSQALVIR